MNSEEVQTYVRKNVAWAQLPASVKQQLGNSTKEYDKCVIHISLKNQLRYKGSLVQRIRKDESKYYEDLLEFGWKNLLLFPYHLSDVVIKGLGVTPFQYYINMLDNQMAQEKSYDSLPNFTAADCLRLIGIGRNQYIELMNSCRSNRRFFFRKSARELLPTVPLDSVQILPWWYVQIGYITEDDMKAVDKAEHCLIDQLIDNGSCPAGYLNYQTVRQLFTKGFIYFDVPIDDDDYVVVPPLEGFVMNRVQGDYFETLLYKIFVSIDENTTVAELAKILEVESKLVKHAVSLYCRLGFAKKKNSEMDSTDIHPSWYTNAPNAPSVKSSKRSASVSSDEDDSLLKELNKALEVDDEDVAEAMGIEIIKSPDGNEHPNYFGGTNSAQKKIGFLFDSTLTAYLMMGNLSVGLKTHAVTMFEVGKLCDESLDSLVQELSKVAEDGEGEAARYYLHARNLKQTIQFLRSNSQFNTDSDEMCLPLDLVRCESLQSLDPRTASRLLSKNYALLISMAPLTNEIRPFEGCFPPHLGSATPEVSSVWFKMYIYHSTGSGPPSLFLPRGYKISRLPKIFEGFGRLLVTTWGHDPTDIPLSGALPLLIEALQHSPVLVQAYSTTTETATNQVRHVPFPLSSSDQEQLEKDLPMWKSGTGERLLPQSVNIRNSCGYISLLKLDAFRDIRNYPRNGEMNEENASLLQEEIDNIPDNSKGKSLDLDINEKPDNWMLLDVKFGIPLFDTNLNRAICQGIVINSLWKSSSLEALEKSNEELCQTLNDFIYSHQDLPLKDADTKLWLTPEERRKSPVPLPTRALFFDGQTLQENFR